MLLSCVTGLMNGKHDANRSGRSVAKHVAGGLRDFALENSFTTVARRQEMISLRVKDKVHYVKTRSWFETGESQTCRGVKH